MTQPRRTIETLAFQPAVPEHPIHLRILLSHTKQRRRRRKMSARSRRKAGATVNGGTPRGSSTQCSVTRNTIFSISRRHVPAGASAHGHSNIRVGKHYHHSSARADTNYRAETRTRGPARRRRRNGAPTARKDARAAGTRGTARHLPWLSVLKTSSRLSSSLSFFPRRRFFPPFPLFFGMVAEARHAEAAPRALAATATVADGVGYRESGLGRSAWATSTVLLSYERA